LRRSDCVSDRQELRIVAQQIEQLAIEPQFLRAGLQVPMPCCSRSARRQVNALWKRIFAAASLTSIALAMS
jgi:hypothetical protein